MTKTYTAAEASFVAISASWAAGADGDRILYGVGISKEAAIADARIYTNGEGNFVAVPTTGRLAAHLAAALTNNDDLSRVELVLVDGGGKADLAG